jgi:putative endonuclease
MYTLYILKSNKYPKTYVGYTNNLNRRLKEHNNGQSNFTNKYKPWSQIYSENCSTKETALNREKYFKSKKGRKLIAEMLK